MAVPLRVVAALGGAIGIGLFSLAAVLVRLDRPARLAPMPDVGAGNVHSRFAGPAVQESVWAAGAVRGYTDLCNVEQLSTKRSFTFKHGPATSTAAFVVRLVGNGWASTEALPIELSLIGLVNSAASRRGGRAIRDTRREFVLQPLVGGLGGDEGVVPIIPDSAATRGYSSWTARASVREIKARDCTDPGKYTVEVLALQPSGSVVSLEFSWDKHVCALLMAFWAVVRVLASLKDAPSTIACDLYCIAYGMGVVAWTAVGLFVRWEHVWRVARLVTWVAALGDIALVMVVVLDCDGGFLAAPFLSPRRSRGGELKKSDEVLETASPRNDKMPGGTMYPQRVTLSAAAAASLLPLLWPCMPPGTFLCADGSDPRDMIREEIPVTARLLPLLLALPVFMRKWWCKRPGCNQEIWLCEVSVLAFLSAPAIACSVPRLFPRVLHRKVQLLVSVLGCRTAGATGLVAWNAWYRSGADGSSASGCRCASIVLALLVCVMVYWQAMAAVAAEPSHWVFPAAPLSKAPMSVEQFCAPVVAAVAAAAPPNATMPQVLHQLQGTDRHVQSSSWAWNPNSTRAVAIDNFTGAMSRLPSLASVQLGIEVAAVAGARREGIICTAEAMRPLRSRIVQGEECGDQGWNQQFTFRALTEVGNGTAKICVSEATTPPVRFQVLKGCTSEEGWLPRFSFHAMEKAGKGLTQLCVSKAINPPRWKLSFARTCNDRTFKQSFVFFIYDFAVTISSKSSSGAKGPAATAKLEAEKAELLRLARAEADALQALLSDVPLHIRQSHPLYNASLTLRRKYFGQAYNVQVDPDGLKEKKNLMHSWNEEINARHRLHCQGWLQDRTESVVCPPPGQEEQVRPVNRSCRGHEAAAKEPFLRVASLAEEFKTFCRAKDAGGPVWGELKDPKCANARQATQELLDKTHADSGPSNEAEAGFDNCPTCAVVGSSGNLLASSLGNEIDAHDVVMRINCAPTLGFSSDVGRKTTHRILYPEASWFAGDKDQPCEQLASLIGEGSSVIAVLFKPVDIEWWHHVVLQQPAPQTGFWHPVPRRMELAGTRVAVLAPSWMTRATQGFAQLLQGKNGTVKREGWPSSGMLALMLALQRCKSVDVYGFGLHFRNGSALGAAQHKYYVE